MKFTKETAKRTMRTFIQAFLPALVVGVSTMTFGEDGSITKGAIVALVIPAIAAGIAAVMNLETGGDAE
ncbi:MAG: hypothetical protein IKS12_07130 [Eubacterium sp.]|nr:hypothetical protein [Eubacterium sp.]